MIRILVMLVICNIVIATEEEDKKFIDLLPAKEKKAFLDRIARRILEKVESKDLPDGSHADVSDEQLDAQTAFVEEILREESENLRKQRRRNKHRKSDEEVKPVTENFNEVELQGQHLDLTLRDQQKRINKRNREVPLQHAKSTTESTYRTIFVETIYDTTSEYNDSFKNKQMINDTRKNTDLTRSSTAITRSTSSDTNYKINVTNAGDFLESLNKTNLEQDLRIGTSATIDFGNRAINNSENVNYTFLSTPFYSDEDKTTTENGETTEQTVVWNLTEKNNVSQGYNLYEKSVQGNNSNGSKVETLLDSSTSATEMILDFSRTTHDLTTSNKFEGDTLSPQTEKSEENTGYLESSTSTLRNILRSNTNVNENEIYTDEKEDYNTKLSLKSATNDYKINNESTSLESNVQHGTRYIEKQEFAGENSSNKLKIVGNNSESGRLLNDTENKVYLRFKSEKEAVVELHNENTKPKGKIHEVYEIDPRISPFVAKEAVKNKNVSRKMEENTGASHNIPVYNFDPKNAYYNKHTRFVHKDSNQDDEVKLSKIPSNKIFFNKHNLRSWFGENNKESIIIKHRRPKVNYNPATLFLNLLNIPKVRHTPTLFINTDDYVDYYLGRSFIRSDRNFPTQNSNEEEHPNNLLSKNHIKNRLRTARIQEINEKFNLLTAINKTKSKSIKKQPESLNKKKLLLGMNPRNRNGLFKEKHNHKNCDQSIALDYYFGRQRSEERIDDFNFLNVKPLTKSPMHKHFQKKHKLDDRYKAKPNARSNNVTFSSIITVLKDFIKMDNNALISYPWLKSTVDIRAGIYKILHLIDKFHYEPYMHPKDVELLKYIFYLYKYSNLMIITEEKSKMIRNTRKKSMLPKNKKKRRIKEPWKLIRDVYSFLRDSKEDQPLLILHELEDFLNEVLSHLDLFHRVVRKVAEAKTYNTQSWFNDLKDAFLKSANERELEGVILHLSMYRLFKMVEESSESILEGGFKKYVQNNRDTVENTREEFVFVLKLLQELNFSVNI